MLKNTIRKEFHFSALDHFVALDNSSALKFVFFLPLTMFLPLILYCPWAISVGPADQPVGRAASRRADWPAGRPDSTRIWEVVCVKELSSRRYHSCHIDKNRHCM